MESKKFTVMLNSDSRKVFGLLAKHDKNQISKKHIQLGNNPYQDTKKLKGMEFWRVRVGDFGIIYKIDKGILFVFVIRTRLWKDIYKSL